MSKNILVCTLGASDWVVPESYDFLVHPEKFSSEVQAERTKLIVDGSSVQDIGVWIVTTSNIMQNREHEKLWLAWAAHEQLLQNFSIFVAPATTELGNYAENETMMETIYRVVLKAKETVKKEGGKVFLSIAGGRKTMSSYLHQADRMFGSDGVFHVVAVNEANFEIAVKECTDMGLKNINSYFNNIKEAGVVFNNDEESKSFYDKDHKALEGCKKKLYCHLRPTCILSSSGWSEFIHASVTHANGGNPLLSKDFPIEPISLIKTTNVPPFDQNNIREKMKNAEKNSNNFFQMVLRSGVATYTLYHDLCLNGTIRPELSDILPCYLAGINSLVSGTYYYYDSLKKMCPFGQKIIEPALKLGGLNANSSASPALSSDEKGQYALTLMDKNRTLKYSIAKIDFGLDKGLLLILLRNLLKNAFEHGEGENISLNISGTDQGCRIEVTNQASVKTIEEEKYKNVFIPFASSKNIHGELHGLGGFAARAAAERLGGELKAKGDENTKTVTFWCDLKKKTDKPEAKRKL